MPPEQAFSHLTAAVLHGMRLPEGYRGATLHVTALRGTTPPRRPGVVGHEARDLPTVLIDGLRAVAPVAVWCQLAASLSLDDVVVMGDGLVRRRGPVATLDELRSAVAGVAGRRGARRLRTALQHIRPGTDSARETRLRLLIVRAGLPEPAVNEPIVNRYGAVIAHGDLVYREYRTLIEYDGTHHFEDAAQYRIDIDRLDAIMEEDWRVIRVDKRLFARRATLLAKINTALRAHGWRP